MGTGLEGSSLAVWRQKYGFRPSPSLKEAPACRMQYCSPCVYLDRLQKGLSLIHLLHSFSRVEGA